MNTGICNLSVVPLRAAASHRSEMVSQVLFGEDFEIIEQGKDWAFVRLSETKYEGWIQQGQFIVLPDTELLANDRDQIHVVDVVGQTKALSEKGSVELVPGTKIPKWMLQEGKDFFPYQVEAKLRKPSLSDFASEFPKLVDFYRNRPYLWGGRTHYGIDCSGLSQIVFSQFGIVLPRDAYQQAEGGTTVDFIQEIKPGDLAFFDNEEGRITHVGIMIDPETIFHASASVRIDKLDAEGIFNAEKNRYTHKLRIVKRYF